MAIVCMQLYFIDCFTVTYYKVTTIYVYLSGSFQARLIYTDTFPKTFHVNNKVTGSQPQLTITN